MHLEKRTWTKDGKEMQSMEANSELEPCLVTRELIFTKAQTSSKIKDDKAKIHLASLLKKISKDLLKFCQITTFQFRPY